MGDHLPEYAGESGLLLKPVEGPLRPAECEFDNTGYCTRGESPVRWSCIAAWRDQTNGLCGWLLHCKRFLSMFAGHFRQYRRLSGLFVFWHCLHWP